MDMDTATKLTSKIDIIISQNKAITQELEEIKNSQTLVSTKMDFQNQKIIDLEAKLEVVTLENRIMKKKLEAKDHLLLQRTDFLEIHGIPEKEEENLKKEVENMVAALNQPVHTHDIRSAIRLPSTRRPAQLDRRRQPPVIMVKFNSPHIRALLLQNRQKLRNVTGQKIYVHENLTKHRR